MAKLIGPGETESGAPREPEASVEVFVQQGRDGLPRVGIQVNTRSRNLGWRPQKTLLLTPEQMVEVRRQLAAVDAHLQRLLWSDDDSPSDRGKLLPFPQVRMETAPATSD